MVERIFLNVIVAPWPLEFWSAAGVCSEDSPQVFNMGASREAAGACSRLTRPYPTGPRRTVGDGSGVLIRPLCRNHRGVSPCCFLWVKGGSLLSSTLALSMTLNTANGRATRFGEQSMNEKDSGS
ncbi:hypothetical protein Bbelb_294110 [Branchiostoma belcheri]|nr:hypothetical protein Bbelb_294110 [Branchiostoma belcheri]